MSRARRVAAVVVLLGAVGLGVWWSRRAGAGSEPLAASGTVEATQSDLGFQQPGRIHQVLPREGDAVDAGQELASLDQSELRTRVEAAKAQLQAAEARLRELERGSRAEEVTAAEAAAEAARSREEEAAADATRAQRLYESGAISRQALERAETALATARAARVQAEQALAIVREGPRPETVEAQRALVEQARAAVAQASAVLEQSVIVAPFSGRVTVRHREPGEIVPAGAPVLTLLNLADRWVRIYVPENALGRVSLGQSVEIRASTFPDRGYAGEVVFIGDVAEFTPRNVQTAEERTRLVYQVKVRITGDPTFDLKPGIPADVTFPAPSGETGGS